MSDQTGAYQAWRLEDGGGVWNSAVFILAFLADRRAGGLSPEDYGVNPAAQRIEWPVLLDRSGRTFSSGERVLIDLAYGLYTNKTYSSNDGLARPLAAATDLMMLDDRFFAVAMRAIGLRRTGRLPSTPPAR